MTRAIITALLLVLLTACGGGDPEVSLADDEHTVTVPTPTDCAVTPRPAGCL